MNCRELIDYLLDYFADDLPSEVLVLLHAHLAACPECVAYLQNYERTLHFSREAFREPAVPVPEELIQAILLARRAP